MRKIYVSGVSTVIATALLVLVAAPLAFCEQAESCPMREARSRTSGVTCVPGPAFDCCNGDETAPSRGADELTRHDLGAPIVSPRPALVTPRSRSRFDSERANEPLGSAAETPLYTLLATLLI